MPWLGASPSRTLRGMTVLEDAVLEELADVLRDLLAEVRALVVHRQQDAGDVERGVERGADPAQRGDEIGEPLEREVLAVERNQHRVGGDERVQRQQAERRRRVDEDVVEVRRGAARAARAAGARGCGSETSSISAPVRLRSAGMSDRPRCGRQDERSQRRSPSARGERVVDGAGRRRPGP